MVNLVPRQICANCSHARSGRGPGAVLALLLVRRAGGMGGTRRVVGTWQWRRRRWRRRRWRGPPGRRRQRHRRAAGTAAGQPAVDRTAARHVRCRAKGSGAPIGVGAHDRHVCARGGLQGCCVTVQLLTGVGWSVFVCMQQFDSRPSGEANCCLVQCGTYVVLSPSTLFQGSTYRSSKSAMERWAKLQGPTLAGAPHVLRLLRTHAARWVWPCPCSPGAAGAARCSCSTGKQSAVIAFPQAQSYPVPSGIFGDPEECHAGAGWGSQLHVHAPGVAPHSSRHEPPNCCIHRMHAPTQYATLAIQAASVVSCPLPLLVLSPGPAGSVPRLATYPAAPSPLRHLTPSAPVRWWQGLPARSSRQALISSLVLTGVKATTITLAIKRVTGSRGKGTARGRRRRSRGT